MVCLQEIRITNTLMCSRFPPMIMYVYVCKLKVTVSCLLALGSSSLLSIGWDCHLLFWQGIEPIRLTNREVFPVEESQPQSGFKLGPSTVTEYLPLSVCEVAGFGVLVLFTTRDVDITYYTFSHVPSS